MVNIGGILEGAADLIDIFYDSDEEKAEAKLKLIKLQQDGKLKEFEAKQKVMLAQMEVNKVEASHKSIFVAGWRPFVGWVCGFGVLYSFIVHPLIEWACVIFKLEIVAPKLETAILINLLLGMLGMAGVRAYEKIKGVDTSSIGKVKKKILEKK